MTEKIVKKYNKDNKRIVTCGDSASDIDVGLTRIKMILSCLTSNMSEINSPLKEENVKKKILIDSHY